jgi:nucleoside-diphosphate-sugar epimerase
VGGYPPDVQVKWDMPVRPCCEYGASKCYGEALGHYFADQRGVSVIAIRIGGVHGHDEEPHKYQSQQMDYLVSEEDLTQLLTKCVEAPEDLQFAIVHGLSDNRFKRLDLSHTREILGYEPSHDSAEDYDELEVPEPQPIHEE